MTRVFVCLFFILLLDIKKLFSLFVLIYYYYFGCFEIEYKFCLFVCFFSLFFISLRIQFFIGIIILTKSRQRKKNFLPFKMNRIGRSSIHHTMDESKWNEKKIKYPCAKKKIRWNQMTWNNWNNNNNNKMANWILMFFFFLLFIKNTIVSRLSLSLGFFPTNNDWKTTKKWQTISKWWNKRFDFTLVISPPYWMDLNLNIKLFYWEIDWLIWKSQFLFFLWFDPTPEQQQQPINRHFIEYKHPNNLFFCWFFF